MTMAGITSTCFLNAAIVTLFAVASCHAFCLMPPTSRNIFVLKRHPSHSATGTTTTCLQQANSDETHNQNDSTPLPIHHTAIKTRNITVALQFYSLLGFEAAVKFRAGPARAAWLESSSGDPNSFCRLELIEVPQFMLDEPEGIKRRAIDFIQRQELLGHNHLALDVTSFIQQRAMKNLQEWLDYLNEQSEKEFGKCLRIAVEPYQTIIGNGVYELAFLYDADGALVELLNRQTILDHPVSSGWDVAAKFDFSQ